MRLLLDQPVTPAFVIVSFLHFTIASNINPSVNQSKGMFFLRNPKTRQSWEYVETGDWNWETWKSKYQKIYKTLDVDWRRYLRWKENYVEITRHNDRYAAGQETYLKGLNSFADAATTEVLSKLTKIYPHYEDENETITSKMPVQHVPANFDWRIVERSQDGVRFQGFFPRGWVFAALEVIQSQLFLKTGKNFALSPQEVVDCMWMYGYIDGSVKNALTYVRMRGISLSINYPFVNTKSRICKKQRRQPITLDIQSIHRLAPYDENNLKRTLVMIGPVAAKIQVTPNFIAYSSGVFYDTMCRRGHPSNHAVLVVGYGTDLLLGDFWILKNSWGISWGEDGYIRIARNTFYDCGITSTAFYIVLQ